jgi:serine/threonine protein kinase/formylglycine-generating enzyme required for sulfatase activity
MTPEEDSPQSLERQLLERFLAEHPGGGAAQLQAWSERQPEVRERPELLPELERLLRASEVLRMGLPPVLEQADEDASFFRRRRVEWREQDGADGPDLGNLSPGDRVGHFTLQSFIAKGGMGQVWEAIDEKLGSRVALKLVLHERLDTRALELFAREARAGGRLNHPNIVTTRSFDVDGRVAWIAQELVEGSWTLKDFLDELRAADAVPKGYYPRVAATVAQVADALQAAHDAGVIHRDVKPANVLIAPDGTPKLTDFGLARVENDPLVSMTGDFAGTWSYMSPEQVTAKRMGLDHRSDVFSLGVVLYELLALRRPFEGDTTHQIAEKIIAYDPPDASRVRSQCPGELAVICGKALEKLPGHRYGSAAEFAADLRRHLNNEPIQARPPGPVSRARKWVRRNPAVSSAGLVGALAMVVVSTLLVDRWRAAREMTELAASESEQRRVAEAQREQVLRLSAQANLEDLLERQGQLWPATPERIGELQAWIAEAEELCEQRSGFEEQLAKVRLEARALSPAERAEQRERHPAQKELLAVARELELRRIALENWRGATTPGSLPLEASADELDPVRDHARAWEWVAPERTEFGQEDRGLALALACLEAAPAELVAPLWATVAWGRVALGDGDGALVAGQRALDSAPEARRSLYDDQLARIDRAVERGRSAQGQAQLQERITDLARQRSELEAQLDQRIEWTFDDPDLTWWNRELERLLAGLEALEEELLGPDAVTVEHGWSVVRRLEFARQLASDLGAGGRSRAAWDAHLSGIRADFPGFEERSDLMPLGRDRSSCLWEFAHLASGAPARRDSAGQLQLNADTGVVLILVPGGQDWLGVQGDDPDGINYDERAEPDEGPPFRASLDPYFLSKYEFTQGQWRRATGAEPSFYKRLSFANDLLHPVEQVSWTECVEVCKRLGLRLPSEFEWEFACRAGTDTPWSFGDSLESAVTLADSGDLKRLEVNIADASARAAGATWRAINDAADLWDGSVVHGRVGSYPPNPFGFHEMHGNLFEWCSNEPNFGPPGPERQADPIAPVNAETHRISRGGGFRFPGFRTRSSHRFDNPADFRAYILGLRPAMGLE